MIDETVAAGALFCKGGPYLKCKTWTVYTMNNYRGRRKVLVQVTTEMHHNLRRGNLGFLHPSEIVDHPSWRHQTNNRNNRWTLSVELKGTRVNVRTLSGKRVVRCKIESKYLYGVHVTYLIIKKFRDNVLIIFLIK